MANEDIIATIRQRKSVRTFEKRPLTNDDRATVQAKNAAPMALFALPVRT